MSFKTPNSLEELFANDPLGLLDDVKATAPKVTATPTEVANFKELVSFYEKHQRAPSPQSKDFFERQLGKRLTVYRNDPAFKASVQAIDTVGLLRDEPVAPAAGSEPAPVFASMEDIFKSDDFGLLDEGESSILHIEHVPAQTAENWNWPDEVATRTPCKHFELYEKLFNDMQRDIINGVAKTVRFKHETDVHVGDFFILSGLLALVDDIVDPENSKRGRPNPRLRVIFENGIETHILQFSFTRALYKDPHGRRVLPDEKTVLERLQGITHKDRPTGCIYVLASETKAPALADLKHQGRLVKIGFSTQSVEERVKNAVNDPTYLEAPVRILASLDCYNLNPQKVEHLIHAFLVKQRLNMTLISSKGVPYHPTEWFAVDRDTAIDVAKHIVAGDIMEYRMDNTTGRLKRKDVSEAHGG